MTRYIFGCILLSLILSCAPPSNLKDKISGKWKMVGVLIFNDDASPVLNPMQNRWLSFGGDDSFTSGSGETQENAGSYKLSETEARLDLDSDAGPGDDSSWRLSFRNDTLVMRGIGTDRQENSEVLMVR